MKKVEQSEKKSFKSMLLRLEEITSILESESIELEDSIKLYEEGIKISAYCMNSLKEAELKISELKNNIDSFEKQSEDNF